MPWKNYSRHCSRCGEVGPRVPMGAGYVHSRCLTPTEKRKRREDAGYISNAMRAELLRLANGKPLILTGRSQAGGRTGLVLALHKRGLIDAAGGITTAGLAKIGRVADGVAASEEPKGNRCGCNHWITPKCPAGNCPWQGKRPVDAAGVTEGCHQVICTKDSNGS